jgi:hypothetical protein
MTFSENHSNTFANVSSGQTCTLMLKVLLTRLRVQVTSRKRKYRKRNKMKSKDQENSTRMIKVKGEENKKSSRRKRMGRNSRKDNDVSVHAAKAYTASSSIAPLIRYLGTK